MKQTSKPYVMTGCHILIDIGKEKNAFLLNKKNALKLKKAQRE